jgi:hypothetical protein
MVALTRDLHVVASRVTTRFSAEFFPTRHIAKTWYVRALFRLLICHYNLVLSRFARVRRSLIIAIFDLAVCRIDHEVFRRDPLAAQLPATTSSP